MNINIKNEYAAEVILGTDELDALGITFEELDYSNAETRRVLWLLLDEIRKCAAVDINFSGKLLIEVMKESRNRVRISFTSLSAGERNPKSVKQLVKSECAPILSEFSDFETLLKAVCSLKNVTDSALYEKNGVFRLELSCEKNDKAKMLPVLYEFSDFVKESVFETAVCREMWNCILPSDAVCTLRRSFSMQ